MAIKKCIKCNKEKAENEFYASWSHWCNECIDKRNKEIEIKREYKESIQDGGIDGREGKMSMRYKGEYD